MSFDEVQFPLKVSYGASGGPRFSTDVIAIDGGYERRNQNWSAARRRFDARTGVRSSTDAAMLLSFFHARAGRARGFRLKDWSDFSSAPDHVAPPGWSDQIIGTGDGLTATFQLVKNYGSGGIAHQRVIRKPREETILVGVDHMQLLTGWSVETTTGLLTFAIPPTTGQVVTAGFYFDVPVRFDDDQLNLSSEDNNTSKSEIPLVEIRVG